MALQEIHAEVQHRLLPDERKLGQLREENLSWEEIADRLGGSAAALRQQWSRAMKRIAGELGIDEADDG